MEAWLKTLKAASGKAARQNPEGNGGNALKQVIVFFLLSTRTFQASCLGGKFNGLDA